MHTRLDPEYGDGIRVEFFEARFQGHAYQKHRHDTYAICLTTTGVLGFDYRGTSEISTPGQVVVLYPDEVHDGYAGTEKGFGYRQLYVELQRRLARRPGRYGKRGSDIANCMWNRL